MKYFVVSRVVVEPLNVPQTEYFNTVTASVRPIEVVMNPVVGKAVRHEDVERYDSLA